MGEESHKPYKGYIVLPRGIVLPFLSKESGLLDFGVYIAMGIECDWDRKHDTYGCLTKNNVELADRWGCDPASVSRYKHKLIRKGLLINHGGLVRIRHFELFEIGTAKRLANIPLASSQDLFANLHEINANMQDNLANLQEIRGRNSPQSFNVSSKGNLSLSNDEDESFSDEEMDHITREIDEMRGERR